MELSRFDSFLPIIKSLISVSKVWSVESKAALKTLPNMLSKSNDVPNSKSTCSISFSKCGQWLAVPTEQMVLVLSRANNWEQAKEVKITSLAAGEIVTTCDWDAEGGNILAGTNKVFGMGKLTFSSPDYCRVTCA